MDHSNMGQGMANMGGMQVEKVGERVQVRARAWTRRCRSAYRNAPTATIHVSKR